MARSLAPSLETGDTRLFLGTDTESKFSKWLDKILKGLNVVQQAILGSDICDFGTHSNRKGVATYVSSCPAGPSMISIFLRAGWSLGSVQQRYIFAGAGADQLVGRCASGLPINDNEFATLPPPPLNLADLHRELEVWTTAILDRIALAAGRSGAGAAPALLDGAAENDDP